MPRSSTQSDVVEKPVKTRRTKDASVAERKSSVRPKKMEPSKRSRASKVKGPLGERLAFDVARFDEFVMGSSDPTNFMREARLSTESFGQMKLFKQKQRWIIGVDEVGRGCLAGPVVACAVVLPGLEQKSEIAERLALLDDSKKLAASVRENLSTTIRGCAQYAIAEASPKEIDTINIFHASLLAMKRAVNSLVSSAMIDLRETLILIDGKWTLPDLDANQLPVIKGDTRSAAIAAASVVAKVYRDALMKGLSESFPHYQWQSNKGYPSGAHRQAIVEHGMTEWHRRSFRCLPEGDPDDRSG
ncbi:MAG: ribonuclease HII [Candidatus Obscuribacterales bacterium]|nr:ribonuclease HII [Candidatus Obscuribacterales bacterium]